VKVLSTSVPIFTRDIEAARRAVRGAHARDSQKTVRDPEQGIQIAILGSLTIIAGPEKEIGALRHLRATFIVDSLAEFDAHLRSTGATTLQRSRPTPAGTNLIVRDVEGVVFEFVEPHSKESFHVDK
jgi:hypothetical protein